MSQLMLPRIIGKLGMNEITNKFTVAFSNTPGAVKPLYYKTLDGNKIFSIRS